ncbi:MAG: GDSL-type esterase/lipase family protein [Nannocystaceae bacterium]
MTPPTPTRPDLNAPARRGLGRRGLLRASLHAGLLGALGPLAALRPRTARAAAPRVLLLGDSMIAGALGLFLERRLRDDHGYEVQRYGKSSTGLARPDFFSWTKEAQRQIEAFPDPDAVVAMFGGNDVQGLYMGRPEGPRGKRGPAQWITWHDEGWRHEYARRITEFADIVAPDGRLLFWIGMPVMRPEKFHERVRKVNLIARAEMAIRPGGRFVDIWRLLADDAGNYADRIALAEDADAAAEGQATKPKAKKVRVRAGDGIHLSVAGANVVEAHVREKIVAELGAAGDDAAADAAVGA